MDQLNQGGLIPSEGEAYIPPAGNLPETGISAPPSEVITSGANGGRRLALILGAVAVVALVIILLIKFILPLLSPKQVIELTWWGLWEDENIIAPVIAEYEAANPGIKISYVKQSQKDYRDRLQSALESGEGPDIFRFHNSWVPMFKSQLDPVPVSVMSPSEFSQAFYPVAVNDLTSGTGIMGIPLEYDAITLFINTDIFNQAGREPPKTWDDLRQLAVSLTIKDDRGVISQAGVALGEVVNVDHWQEVLALLMIQNRGNISAPSGERAETALRYFTLFSQVDKVWDSTLPSSTLAFANGKLAMYFGPSWRVFEINQQNPSLKFRTVPLPQIPKAIPSEPDISYAIYWVEGVNAESSKKEEAWKFLKFMSDASTLEKFYKNAAAVRGFGEPYPRVDMANLLADHPILGSIMTLAPNAKSWYLAAATHDGPSGINSQMEGYFIDAVNSVKKGGSAKAALETLSAGIQQVLGQYQSSR